MKDKDLPIGYAHELALALKDEYDLGVSIRKLKYEILGPLRMVVDLVHSASNTFMGKDKYPPPPEYNVRHGITFVTCCWDCAEKLGWKRELDDGCCTSYEMVCEGCGEMKVCAQPRDFGLTEEDVLELRMKREKGTQ